MTALQRFVAGHSEVCGFLQKLGIVIISVLRACCSVVGRLVRSSEAETLLVVGLKSHALEVARKGHQASLVLSRTVCVKGAPDVVLGKGACHSWGLGFVLLQVELGSDVLVHAVLTLHKVMGCSLPYLQLYSSHFKPEAV